MKTCWKLVVLAAALPSAYPLLTPQVLPTVPPVRDDDDDEDGRDGPSGGEHGADG